MKEISRLSSRSLDWSGSLVVSQERALNLGMTGPMLRGSGIA